MLELDFADLVTRANADGEFPLASRYWNGLLQLVVGDQQTTLRVASGRLEIAEGEEVLGAHGIRIAGRVEDWEKALSPHPPPGWQDLSTARSFTVTADLLDFTPNYPAIRRLTELMAEQVNGPKDSTVLPPVSRTHDDAVGRYVYVETLGTQYRVYYEQTGRGIPLVLLHTAGADGRQWRHLLENHEFQQQYQMTAVDLPFHGKSLPPTGQEWWQNEYLLTREFLIAFLDAFTAALGMNRPVFMGCSVGGLLAPDLAYYRNGTYRAVIGLNAALGLPDSLLADPAKVATWYHPRVFNDWKASNMLGHMSPTSPEVYRRETGWVYSQGAPRVMVGDVYYYMQDHDLSAEQASTIDVAKTGVYLLTGEYDFLSWSGASQQLADAIPGCHFEVNERLGHFGPTENPELFMRILAPILDEIASKYPS